MNDAAIYAFGAAPLIILAWAVVTFIMIRREK